MFNVGDITVDPPVLLAPMEDVTSMPMRLIAKQVAGPGLMFTEFVSAMAIHYGAQKTLKKMRIHPDERPLGIQIFGSDPDIMAETARLCEEIGADIVDINMGCWVPKVCKTGSGAALLKDPENAVKIVRSVVNAVKVPVSVKVRAGWDYSLFSAPDLAARFQDEGIKMLTLHARFAKQGFEGEADWRLIHRLRSVLQIPLIGNGDVKSGADAVRMMNETGCDGVMVGRAAISNPWCLRDVVRGVQGLPPLPGPSLDERIDIAIRHAEMTVAVEHELAETHHGGNMELAENRAIRSLRGQLPIYIKGTPGAASIRQELYQANALEEVRSILKSLQMTTV